MDASKNNISIFDNDKITYDLLLMAIMNNNNIDDCTKCIIYIAMELENVHDLDDDFSDLQIRINRVRDTIELIADLYNGEHYGNSPLCDLFKM